MVTLLSRLLQSGSLPGIEALLRAESKGIVTVADQAEPATTVVAALHQMGSGEWGELVPLRRVHMRFGSTRDASHGQFPSAARRATQPFDTKAAAGCYS
jgi:hypothetical protein